MSAVSVAFAQETEADEDEIIELSPFEVTADEDVGYMAANTLAGTRLRTDLRDVGSSVSVYTEEFLDDIGAVDNETLLSYAANVEVGGMYSTYTGNNAGEGTAANESARFPNPSTTTRVRGLAAADNSKDFFLTRIPWDGYNVARVDINRGANAILFGLGSPAGIINTTTVGPEFNNMGEISFRVGSYGSTRAELDYNHQLIENQMAVRVAAVYDDTQYRQDPAYEEDKRLYGAFRYEPDIFRGLNGLTSIKVNAELAEVEGNRPRTITPVDFISPWFRDALPLDVLRSIDSLDNLPGGRSLSELGGVGKETFTPFQLEEDYSQEPNTGQRRSNYTDGSANPYFNPAIGNFAQLFGGPLAVFPDHTSPDLSTYYLSEFRNIRGIGPDGTIDRGVGFPYQRLGGIGEFRNFATQAGLPFAEFGQYKNVHLQDDSIFDFYNQLIDGPNKQEKQDWNTFNLTAAQTAWDNKIGVEFAYDRQDYYEEQWALLTDQRNAIHIDINSEWADGSPNPNVGRPFISDNGQYGNSSLDETREVFRWTVYTELRLDDFVDENFFTRLVGKHRFTGLYSIDEFERDSRNWMLFGTPWSFDDYVTSPGEDLNSADNVRIPNAAIYLGPALFDRNSAAGANIPNPSARIAMSNGPLYNFDSTWIATDVDPAAEWFNPFTSPYDGLSTQSENFANYVGWSNYPLEVIRSEDGYRDQLTTAADLFASRINSKAFVWQGYFWDGAVVGTWGYRHDRVRTKNARAPFRTKPNGNTDNLRDVSERVYQLGEEWTEDQSDSSLTWSVVVHLNDLLDDMLPIDVSVSYNESENFNPAGNRRDIYGEELGPPTGGTEDYSLWLATKDNRFSFRVTKYETYLQNATSGAIGGNWFLGAVMAWGGNWANIFEYDLSGYTLDTANGPNAGRYNYSPGEGETAEDAAAREAAAIAGFRALQDSIDPRYWDAWGLDPDLVANQSASAPPGFTITEDSVSEGYEFEFIANPTSNWRISVSASQTEAVRRNVGGEALVDFVETVDNALNNTPAGDLRIWWGGAGNTTTLREWNAVFAGNYSLKKLQEGTATPEIREWNYTVVTNYSFRDGYLKGFNVGGSYRWQDNVVIGYPITVDGEGNFSYDLDRPYNGPTEDFIDLWVGYQRKLTDSIDWRIQVNVRNAFEDDGVIPISVQPDGETWAAVRIKPEQTWFITNTFTF